MVDSPFEQVAAIMPQDLRRALKQLPQGVGERVEEIRLRQGLRPSVLLPTTELSATSWILYPENFTMRESATM